MEMPAEYEGPLRLGIFLAVLLLMALWEQLAPRRPRTVRPLWRRVSNLSLVAINVGAVRLAVPITLVGAAMLVQAKGWGLLQLVDWPVWLEFVLTLLIFDLSIYLQHVMLHAVPLLWRLHMVHHADLDLDVTSGLRFHTLEILLSLGIKLLVVVAVGPPALAVLVFEITLNATSMFNHSNVNLPVWLDGWVRLLLVTPDMHRVHHSVRKEETNSNFGFNLPWWDYLLGTYRAEPREGQLGMTIGLSQFRREQQVGRLPGMWLLPFGRQPPAMLEEEHAESRSSAETDSS